jgi:hypothetical protein
MDFSRAGGFYASPFPADDRRLNDGTVDLTGHPNPSGMPFIDDVIGLLDGQRDGFGTTSAAFFSLDGPLGTLPDLEGSLRPDAATFLVSVDPAAADYGQRYPVDVGFASDGGPLGAPNLLALLPLQGLALRPRTRYAAVVTRDLIDADGERLGVSLSMAELAAGDVPAGLDDPATWHEALAALEALGVPPDEVAGLAVFTTGDPTAGLLAMRQDGLSRPLPAPDAPLALVETFDAFCVYGSTISMPTYQAGEPPYLNGGGGIAFEDGVPMLYGTETAAMWVTLPRSAMPADGYPTAVMIPTGGGGDRPLVDRGVHAEAHGEAIAPGSGPALHFARAGFAGVSIDGPHGGLRNVSGGDQQFLMFNMTNPEAMLDNLRQSSFEAALTAHLLDGVSIDASDCPGATADARFDTGTLALFGHSMGATIAPPAVAIEPRYGATIWSGAGSSWVENVVFKQSPLETRPLAEALVGYTAYTLTEHDPFLSIVQWAGEASDPPPYALLERPRLDVLMVQGIVDTYILPPMANATSLAFGLDLGGDALDATHPDLAVFPSLQTLLPFSGHTTVDLPAGVGADGATALVVQHAEDGVEDGHEVIFQSEAPMHQYRCFLASFAEGATQVVPGGAADAACPP